MAAIRSVQRTARAHSGFPWYTYNYWITETQSISGERIFVFTAEFFDYRPVYVIDEEGREVEVFSVRPRWVYDPP